MLQFRIRELGESAILIPAADDNAGEVKEVLHVELFHYQRQHTCADLKDGKVKARWIESILASTYLLRRLPVKKVIWFVELLLQYQRQHTCDGIPNSEMKWFTMCSFRDALNHFAYRNT